MSNDISFNIEQMFVKQLVRYDRLNYILPLAFEEDTTYELNIFFDMSGVYRSIYSRHYIVKVEDYTSFTRCIIDICTHYRGYFKFFNVKTNIFLIDSVCIPPFITDIVPNYNKDMQDKKQNKMIDNMVKENLELLDILCPYLPDIHLIHTKYESGVVIAELIQRQYQSLDNKNNTGNLIISTDILPAQLCGLYPKVSFLLPVRYFKEDDSVVISPKTHSEHLETFWSTILLKIGKRAVFEDLSFVSASNLGLILSLSGYKYRNIKSSISFSKAIKLVKELTFGQDIRIEPDSLINSEILNKYKISCETINEVKKYYTGLDIPYQKILFDESIEPKMIHYENLYDPDAINMINDRYFKDNPIDIFKL